MTEKIKFLDKEYSKEDLDAMEDGALLELRNLIASNLGVAGVKSFKDHATAVSQTWKALERYRDSESDAEPAPKKKKEPKERKLAKSAEAKTLKRPTRTHFSTIEKIGEHNGSSHGRAHRWENYKDGMTMADVIETEGTEPWDVYNWQHHGIMAVHEPTDEEYEARRKAWYEKHGRKDPEVEKAEKEAAKQAKKKAEENSE